ncbi:MAG: YaaA family protein [Bacilli bacterium]|jgi:cytoplasmic iron level regulating protein YaaA (DUF328/UPF0246 family)|nr:YaaA family protein [Bacilli bacterium]
MKILFSPSKQMDNTNLVKRANDININEVNDLISFIKNVPSNEVLDVFKTNKNIYLDNQKINVYSKKAIDLYNGISFKQLTNKNNIKYENVIILSALYGYSYAFDYISKYRYDYTMLNSNKYQSLFSAKINELLKDEDMIINLASNEFTKNIKHPFMINFTFYIKTGNSLKQHSVASKKLRGQLLNYLINNKDILYFDEFSYDGYVYDEDLSTFNEFVYVKDLNYEN